MINDSFSVETVLGQILDEGVIELYVNDSFSVETVITQSTKKLELSYSDWSGSVVFSTMASPVVEPITDSFSVGTVIAQSVLEMFLDLNVLDSFGVETEIGQVISGRSVPSAYDQFGVMTVISQNVTKTVGERPIRWFKKCGISPQTIGSWFRQCP
jgi:hypothetical protein